MTTTRWFLAFEAATFILAAAIHSGFLVAGYDHRDAAIAETVIAAVLLAGLTTSLLRPAWTRRAGLIAQGFALLGTLVGIFTILVGVGPQSTPDIVYHIAIVIVLIAGLIAVRREPDA